MSEWEGLFLLSPTSHTSRASFSPVPFASFMLPGTHWGWAVALHSTWEGAGSDCPEERHKQNQQALFSQPPPATPHSQLGLPIPSCVVSFQCLSSFLPSLGLVQDEPTLLIWTRQEPPSLFIRQASFPLLLPMSSRDFAPDGTAHLSSERIQKKQALLFPKGSENMIFNLEK